MKTLKFFLFILTASAVAFADVTAVAVDSNKLHLPNAAVGVMYTGVVEYSLVPLTSDSVFVSLTVNPAAGGANLTLTEVKGDVGVILVNTNRPSVAKTYTIYFQASNAVPGTYYTAHVTANLSATRMKTHSDSLVNVMTKAQKAVLCGGDGSMQGLGSGPIPPIYMADGPHGVRGNGNATCFATCAGECATWDTALAFAQGQAKGEEFRALGRNCSLGPADDIVMHPQGGRASEYYGEDPYLAGRMQEFDVKGIQSRFCIATIKHYACNNKEQNRTTLSAIMNERSLREIYLYNWQHAVVRGQNWGIMSAYNRLSTPTVSYASSNRYIMSTVLREEWAYKFLVMTDWGAGFDNCNSGMSWGADIDMPNPDMYTNACVTGQADSIVNVHARRIILVHEKLGSLVAGYNRYAYQTTLLSAAHDTVVRTVGREGIVLAKNLNNTLPLPKTGAVIALTGPFRNQCRLGPGGSSYVTPPAAKQKNPLQGMRDVLTGIAGASTINDNNTAGANYIVVFVGVTGETEGGDRPNLAVQAGDGETAVTQALAVTTARTIVVFTGGSAASAGQWSSAGVSAILIALYPGQEQGHSIADVLFGDVNPSGKLPVTFPQSAAQLPNFALTGGNLIYPRHDTAHGYFRACKRGETPLFWFGHGLSYTTFSYSNLQVFPTTIRAGDIVHARVTVTNTGSRAGKEVVQLYLSMPQGGALPTRVQDLRGFKKVSLNAGANTAVDFVLTAEEMRVYNPNGTDYANNGYNGIWTVLPGTYGVRVGTSADRTAQPSLSSSFVVQ